MIDAQKANHTITRMCELLELDRRCYYDWRRRRDREPTARQQRRSRLLVKIKAFHAASDGTYGARRITCDLRESGETVSVKTVAKLMRQAGIAGISPRSWRPVTTVKDPKARVVVPDRVRRVFDPGKPNMVWYSDITYLATGQGWAYLCVVRDGHTRRVLGRVIDKHLRADLVEAALRQAVTLRGQLPNKVIFHADRGCQYTSRQVLNTTAEFGLLSSMGRTGVCWDNAAAESFWSTLKNEYYHRHVFPTIAAARTGVYTWIDASYNHTRRHSSIGNQSPLHYEQQLAKQTEQTTTN